MAWAHSTGLGSEIVLREEVVEVPAELRDAVSSETLHIEYSMSSIVRHGHISS